MTEIASFDFDSNSLDKIREYKFGTDWPVNYLIEDGKELYVGQTVRAFYRAKQHLENEDRRRLKKIHIISDNKFNLSAAFDIESSLIEYLVADGKYILQNGNGGIKDHDYFDREEYKAKFEVIWKKLQEMHIAQKDLLQIRNSDLFKYSPYKSLTDDQYLVASELTEDIKKKSRTVTIVQGGPGTGKTILATYLVKRLLEEGEKKVALVIAMSSLRNTLKKVFKGIPGLSSNMVIGPNEISKERYDVLIVDEAHRLRQRRNIVNYKTFDDTNKALGFEKDADELDWVLNFTDHVVLFYDEKQSVRPSDIHPSRFKDIATKEYKLTSQLRVKGGDEYIRFIDGLLEGVPAQDLKIQNYDLKIFDDISEMVVAIKQKDEEHSLSRLVAGYAWKWVSKKNKNVPDIVIDNEKLFWNSVPDNWVNSPNAINEVGCIHTIQGYDLNYTGVIIGPEFSYNPETKTFHVDKSKYFDVNGHKGVDDPQEIKRYVINIYKTILTRGILGTYVYICDSKLRKYFTDKISIINKR